MKVIKQFSVFAFLFPFALAAFDLNALADLSFAEEYAFSSNRAAVVEALRPQTRAWFVYSILTAQNEGRLAEADRLLAEWQNLRGENADPDVLKGLRDRQDLLVWDDAVAKATDPAQLSSTVYPRLSRACLDLGVKPVMHTRKTECAPNTYPSVLDPGQVSFAAFWKAGEKSAAALHSGFEFLLFRGDGVCKDADYRFAPNCENIDPGTPGLFEAVLGYLSDGNPQHVFTKARAFEVLTRRQLESLAGVFEGHEKDLRNNQAFIETMLSKLAPGADEDEQNDPAVKRAWLERILAFAGTLPEARLDLRQIARYNLLNLAREQGDYSAKEFFLDYVKAGRGMRAGSPVHVASAYSEIAPVLQNVPAGTALVVDYLAAFRREGADLRKLYGSWLPGDLLDRVTAETDLLAGKPAEKVNVKCLSDAAFKALRERVELVWSKANPRTFEGNAPVALDLDVKNVKKLQVAIYEVDAFAAYRKYGKAMPADIDLDACVPNVVRTLDYSTVAPIVRHTEHLDFPELAAPGLYVVECSGNGVSSRAVIRKGRVRLMQRHDAGGYVFCALDEEGQIVKGTKLALDGTIFTANENGEIAVPFASPSEKVMKKVAVVQAGRLADALTFDHEEEHYDIRVDGVCPRETLVAGARATFLVRVNVEALRCPAPVSLIKSPRLKFEFRTANGRIVKTLENIKLVDHEDFAYSFTVPACLEAIGATFTCSIHNVTTDKDIPFEVSVNHSAEIVNDNNLTDDVEQMFLRRDAKGYSLELRGRTGEPIPSRVIALSLNHRVFTEEVKVMLQADARGVIELGALTDIESMTAVMGDIEKKWELKSFDLTENSVAASTGKVSAVEGEEIAFSMRDLLVGDWPGAGDLATHAGLFSSSKQGRVQEDFSSSLSYKDGVLHIAPLPAGDYRLYFHTMQEQVALRVTKPLGKGRTAGVIAGRTRGFESCTPPSSLCVTSAKIDGGIFRAVLANVSPTARLHLYASRYYEESIKAFSVFNFEDPDLFNEGNWGMKFSWPVLPSRYLSGRQLGDRLRYVLDRRNLPHTPGVMLARPSLLLNPWQVNETATTVKREGKGGDSWGDVPQACLEAPGVARQAAAGVPFGAEAERRGGPHEAAGPCYDFLPSPAQLFANLHPNEQGVVEFKLPESAAACNAFVVFATDERARDELHLFAEARPFEPRDLRFASSADPAQMTAQVRAMTTEAQVGTEKDAGGAVQRTRYTSVSAVYDLFEALEKEAGSAKSAAFTEFAFVAKWESLTQEEKRDLYGCHACHELDFFLFEKDPSFFAAVVAPNLRNKSFKQFLDHWLLKDDLSAYAQPGAYQNLNVFEQCLLARRLPATAKALAKRLADFCVAHPVAPVEDHIRFDTAFKRDNCYSHVESMCEAGNFGDVPPPASKPAAKRALPAQANGLASADMMARRKTMRQLYRPPERTKEWVETHGWKRRHRDLSATTVTANLFWRDYAAAIAAGEAEKFLSTNVIWANGSFTEKMAALAVLRLPFTEGKGGALVFSKTDRVIEGTISEDTRIGVVQRFVDPKAATQKADEEASVRPVTDEFVQGRVYTLLTVLTNPSATTRIVKLSWQIPLGAIPLKESLPRQTQSVVISPYEVVKIESAFYFPKTESGVGVLMPATVTEGGRLVGCGTPFTCPVVAKSAKTDTTSWYYLAEQGTNEQVLEFLRTGNLAAPKVDLELIGWRLQDKAFMRKVFEALDARGVYSAPLWSHALANKDPADAPRLAQIFAERAARKRAAKKLGPYFKSSLVSIEPEETDLFEHREYWPLVNARVHPLAGKSESGNEGLAKTYREFLNVLAAKPQLTLNDRLLAAVYLLAQDRVEDARRIVAPDLANNASQGHSLQLGYLRAYFAFIDGDMETAGRVGRAYADAASPVWRARFRELRAQVDEVLGKGGPAQDAAAEAPSLALAEVPHEKGAPRAFAVTARALKACTLRAYPIDVEILFSKNPFGRGDVTGAFTFLKPAWEETVNLAADGTARVELPPAFARKDYVLEATGAEGRATARLEVAACELDVQVVKEFGQVRVKGPDGKPVPGAYVKAFARGRGNEEPVFHKDGYTDRRGVFDYASVTSDAPFRPTELSVLVIHDTLGAKTFKVAPPLQNEK